MSRIITETINAFHKGISDDERIQDLAFCTMSKHFDIFTHPKRLVPFRNMEASQNTDYIIHNFLYTNSQIYGLGVVEGSSKTKIYERTGGLITGSWTASTGGEDGSGARDTKCFIHYKNWIFGLAASARIWGWGDITGTPSFTATALNLTSFSNTCQGLVTTDDLLLIAHDNKISVKDGGSSATDNWSLARLTLPDIYIITDMEERGDLVAIACRPKDIGGTSKVFLWNKIDDDVVDVIEWGEGDLYILGDVDGELVGISSVASASSFAISPKLVVRKWAGGRKSAVVKEIETDDTDVFKVVTVYGNHTKIKDGNKLIFGLKIRLNGITYWDLWAFGRKGIGYPFALAPMIEPDNDTIITQLNGCIKIGNYFIIAHNSGEVNFSQDQSSSFNNTAPSEYITQKITGEKWWKNSHRKNKVLRMAGILTAPLPSGTTASLYYRTDENTAWTLIVTSDTDDDIVKEVGQADGNVDFLHCKELQFKAESTGGAEIIGIIFSLELLDADVEEEL